ncbi:MAG: hypothetical protein ACE365_01500 [Gammaproteobacteria bacterium]
MFSGDAFASKLHQVLDNFDFPQDQEDRIRTFCEYFNVPIQKSQMILSGGLIPKRALLERIADELFIDSDDLLAES